MERKIDKYLSEWKVENQRKVQRSGSHGFNLIPNRNTNVNLCQGRLFQYR